ncbi:MAG: LolA family protein [Planctomycetota bacterium]|jgi:outer membrane lipoprotein-sorting protein
MGNRIMVKTVFVICWIASTCWACGCAGGQETPRQDVPEIEPVDAVLERLNKTTSELTSYEAHIEYKYVQPLLESESLHKGVVYYTRSAGTAALRMNFNARKQDDEKEQKYIEQYVIVDGTALPHRDRQFKGIWLAHLDYPLETARYYQLAEPNAASTSADVFELAGRNLPMLGFTKTKDLKKEFDAALVGPEKDGSNDFIQVHLKVKPNSIYKDDYVSMDFWIDKKLGLPIKVVAVKTEPEPPYGEIQEIRFLNPKVNKGIDRKIFEIKIPKGFSEPEITPLPRKRTQE